MFFQQTIQKIPSTPVWTAREEAFEKGTRRPLAWRCFVPLEIHGTEKKRRSRRRRRRRRSSDTCVHLCALASASSVSGWRETSACASVVFLFLGLPVRIHLLWEFFLPIPRFLERLCPMNCLQGWWTASILHHLLFNVLAFWSIGFDPFDFIDSVACRVSLWKSVKKYSKSSTTEVRQETETGKIAEKGVLRSIFRRSNPENRVQGKKRKTSCRTRVTY